MVPPNQPSGQNLNLPLEQLARAADLCHQPWIHAARLLSADAGECTVRLEARNSAGERQPQHDLELEIYRSGADLNLMLSQVADEQAPLLWHGGHAVWLCSDSGEPCPAPPAGAPLEALGRRVRALLAGG